MKKSLGALLIIFLTVLGFKTEASLLDPNIKNLIKETSDSTGNQNEGAKRCGTRTTK